MLTNTNLSKTSFKFVSYRKKSSKETEEKYTGRIKRPKSIYGAFDLAFDNNRDSRYSHQEILRRAANKFCTTCFKTISEKNESIFGEILCIGRKISIEEKITNHDSEILSDYYRQLTYAPKLLNEKGIETITMLWDNYIYQNIIQKDLASLEAISCIIKAIHIGYIKGLNFDDDEIISLKGNDPLKTAINSTLILPKNLFPREF